MSRSLRATVLFIVLCVSLGGTSRAESEWPLYAGVVPAERWSWDETPDGMRIRLVGGSPLAQTDRPDLSSLELLFVVPDGLEITDVVVEPVGIHTEIAPGPLALVGPHRCSDGTSTAASDVPATNSEFPAVWGEFRGLHAWRGFRLAAVTVYPFRQVGGTVPGGARIAVMDSFTVRAQVGSGQPRVEPLQRQRFVPGERSRLEAVLRGVVANPEQLSTASRSTGAVVAPPGGPFEPAEVPSLDGSAVHYLIVTTEDLAGEFQRLADFRTAQGLPAVVVTREEIEAHGRHGVDFQETMRNYLRDAYARWGVQYVLLGGDTQVIPTRYVRNTFHPFGGYTDIPTDVYFGCLDGNWNADGDGWLAEPYYGPDELGDEADLAAEVSVGRAPVITPAEAAVFVDKTIGFESADSGAGWTGRALFLAEVLFPSNWAGPGSPIYLDGATYAEQIITDTVGPCTDIADVRLYENHFEYPGSVTLNVAATIDSLGTGHYAMVNQTGHGYFYNMSVGDDNFHASHVARLHNTNHFLIFGLNCASGAFDVACLMERFVQSADGGAAAAIGSSREAFPATSNHYQQAFYGAMYCQGVREIGDAVVQSRIPFLSQTDRNTVHRWTHLTYNLVGDPALKMWTGTPRSPEIDAPVTLAAGLREVVVTITAAGAPVEGARVCLAKEGETYASAVTGPAGEATLTVAAASAGDAILTVTGPRLARSEVFIPVAVPETFLEFHDLLVDDGTQWPRDGNDNGRAEAGETVEVRVLVRDTGGAGATDVVASLACATPGVNVLVSTVDVGAVPAGGAAVAAGFLLELSADLADGTVAELILAANQPGDEPNVTSSRLDIAAPAPEPVALVWEDATFGNDNGIIENGERIAVSVDLKNFGSGRLNRGEIRLRSDMAGVTLFDSIGVFQNLDHLAIARLVPALSLSFADAAALDTCRLALVDERGRRMVHHFRLDPPAAPSSPQTDRTLGPDVIGLRWERAVDADVRGYHVLRSTNPAGPYVRVNRDLLDGISYFEDRGLEQLSTYYYQIVAVDSSLVESAASAAVGETTAPAEMTGFPIAYHVESSSHTAVGDVTGDGRLEVVLAADEIYVFTEDGDEIFDGDGNAQTLGPITGVNGQFEPAGVALANLDDDAALEIVASERSLDRSIHVYNAEDGSLLPGWPRSMSAWNWATPAVGDVDGDGDPEIVVNALNGWTYVWHHDGTELRDGDQNPATEGVFRIRPDEGWAYPAPTLLDLDGDGALDILIVTDMINDQNGLYAYRHDGTELPGFPYAIGAQRVICSPAAGDLDGDGQLEIVFYSKQHYLHVVQEDGTARLGFPISYEAPLDASAGPSPALGDLDQDGRLEILWPLNAGGTRSDLIVVDADGVILPGWPVTLPGNTESSPMIGDVDGDGVPDIVYAIGGGATEAPDDLNALRADGTMITGFPINLDGRIRGAPVLTDLDQDGDVDIVLAAWDRLLHVWDMPFPYEPQRTPWPTFRGGVARTGVIVDPRRRAVVAADVPAHFVVQPPAPNPFNPQTSVRLYVPEGKQPLRLAVYDLRGRQVRRLFTGVRPAGWHAFRWDGRDGAGKAAASGVYFLRADLGGEVSTHKISLVR